MTTILSTGAEPRRSDPPRLARAEYLRFGAEGRTVLGDQAVKEAIFGYLADMLRPHGVPFDQARFIAGNQNSYSFLAGRCLAALRDQAEPDLIVLAHATADCESSRSLSGYLSTLFRGEPLCFAISDQGALSPFTALHVLGGFGAASRRALIMVLDQSTLPYARGPHDRPGGTDHVLGLLFVTGPGPAGRPLAAVRHRTEVAPDQLGPVLAEVAATLPAADPRASEVIVVAGKHIPAADLAPLLAAPQAKVHGGRRRLRRTPPGPACVAPWAGLAGLTGLADSTAARVLVVGYDRSLASLSIALFDPVTTKE